MDDQPMDDQRPSRRSVYDNLSAADRATVDKVGRLFWRISLLAITGCTYGFCFFAVRIWHWPSWLAYTLGPFLGAAIALATFFAPFWALDRWVSYGRRGKTPGDGPEPPSA